MSFFHQDTFLFLNKMIVVTILMFYIYNVLQYILRFDIPYIVLRIYIYMQSMSVCAALITILTKIIRFQILVSTKNVLKHLNEILITIVTSKVAFNMNILFKWNFQFSI